MFASYSGIVDRVAPGNVGIVASAGSASGCGLRSRPPIDVSRCTALPVGVSVIEKRARLKSDSTRPTITRKAIAKNRNGSKTGEKRMNPPSAQVVTCVPFYCEGSTETEGDDRGHLRHALWAG